MDSLTQALLGAGLQGAMLGRYQGRKALAYGALLATVPDLDVFIRYADPVSSMTYHRGFSHSIFVLTALAALLAWLVKKYRPQPGYSYRLLWATFWLVLVTHPLLDAFTVYGTQLLWPLTPTPQQWSGVFIIDPLYSVPLLLTVLAAWRWGCTPRQRRCLTVALLWGGVYLAAGYWGQWQHAQRVQAALNQQGIVTQRVMATPTPFNILLYRVVVQTDQGAYIEAVSGWLDRTGPEWLRLAAEPPLVPAVQQHPLYRRLAWFSDGWLRHDVVGDEWVVSDLRMGMVGHYTFRFVFARRDGQGQWQAVTPYRHRSNRGGLAELKQIWARIWHSQPPLPLSDWAQTGPP